MTAHRKQLTALFVAALLAAPVLMGISYGPADAGIGCLMVYGDTFMAVAYDEYGIRPTASFTTNDGGLSWREYSSTSALPGCERLGNSWDISNPDVPNARYRAVPERAIERSDDGGRSWVQEVNLAPLNTEAQKWYYRRVGGGYPYRPMNPGPYDALFDDAGGNLVVAMGLDGALVRADGAWRRVSVGPYEAGNIRTRTLGLIDLEYGVAVMLAFLAAGVLFVVARDPRSAGTFRWAATVLVCWMGWAAGLLLTGPTVPGLLVFFAAPAYFFLLGLVLFGVVVVRGVSTGKVHVQVSLGRGVRMACVAAGVAGMFIVPFLLWTQGWLPTYGLSKGLATLIGLLGVGAAYWWFTFRWQPRAGASFLPVTVRQDEKHPTPFPESAQKEKITILGLQVRRGVAFSAVTGLLATGVFGVAYAFSVAWANVLAGFLFPGTFIMGGLVDGRLSPQTTTTGWNTVFRLRGAGVALLVFLLTWIIVTVLIVGIGIARE